VRGKNGLKGHFCRSAEFCNRLFRGGLAELSIFTGAEERPLLAEEESSPFKERFFNHVRCKRLEIQEKKITGSSRSVRAGSPKRRQEKNVLSCLAFREILPAVRIMFLFF
jgi:hypothetical protein